jgi:hypothetical protein
MAGPGFLVVLLVYIVFDLNCKLIYKVGLCFLCLLRLVCVELNPGPVWDGLQCCWVDSVGRDVSTIPCRSYTKDGTCKYNPCKFYHGKVVPKKKQTIVAW